MYRLLLLKHVYILTNEQNMASVGLHHCIYIEVRGTIEMEIT